MKNKHECKPELDSEILNRKKNITSLRISERLYKTLRNNIFCICLIIIYNLIMSNV